jgi:hypothetical protein
MNIQKNFGLKILLKVASNVARSDTDIGHHWAPASQESGSCGGPLMSQCHPMQPENCWLSLHPLPDACPNGILKFSEEKASDGIHRSKSAAR